MGTDGENGGKTIDMTAGELLLTFRNLILFCDPSPIPLIVRVGTLSWCLRPSCPIALEAFYLLGNLHGGQYRGHDLVNIP